MRPRCAELTDDAVAEWPTTCDLRTRWRVASGAARGFRWKPVDDRSAAHLCGVASWDFDRPHRERERLDRCDDGWDDDVPLRPV